MEMQSDIIIVGAGISGLTTATSLAKKGHKVLLLEKNETSGGLVNSFTRDGFIFDGGVRAIENAGMIKPMLKELEIELPLVTSTISLGIEQEVIHVTSEASVNDYETLLAHMYPESSQEVTKVITVIKKFDEYMKVLFGNQSPFFKSPDRSKFYFFTTGIPWFFKFLVTGAAVMRMQKPVEDFLHSILKNPSLFDIISQHFFKKTPAFFAMSYFSLYTDYYYPVGGVGKIPEELEKAFCKLGGTIKKNTTITQIDLNSSILVDQEGNHYSYKNLVWAADLKYLYKNISYDKLPVKTIEKIEQEKQAIVSKKGAESIFTLFMGVNQPPQVYKNIAYGHFFYTPSRKGLGDLQRGRLTAMLADWEHLSKKEILAWLEDFCNFNTYEISIPAIRDPNTAPEGKTGIIASFLMDYELVKRIQEDNWYPEFEAAIEQYMVKALSDTIYPELANNLLFKFSASPLSIERRSGSSEGAIVGWSFEEPIPVTPGLLNMKNSVKTALPNVLKVGQWAASPAGIPTCILTAKLASDLLDKDQS